MNHIIEKLKAHHLAGKKADSSSEPGSLGNDGNSPQVEQQQQQQQQQQKNTNDDGYHLLHRRHDNQRKLVIRNNHHEHHIPSFDLTSHSLAASIHHLVHWRPHPSHRLGKHDDAASLLHGQVNARLDRAQSETCLREKYGDADQFIGKGSFGTVRLAKSRDTTPSTSKDNNNNGNAFRSDTNTTVSANDMTAPPTSSLLLSPSQPQPAPPHNKLYAVKEIKKSPNESNKSYVNRVTEEFLIASKFHHPNIVACVDLLPLQSDSDTYCQVMEFCNAGDLYEHVAHSNGPLHFVEALCFFKQLVRGVHYLHANGLAHRDIKPENLLLTSDGCLKISDFGAADYFLDKNKQVLGSTGVCGSQPYIAPEEYIQDQPYDARKVDVWSCGIVFLVMRQGGLAWQVARADKDKRYALYLLYRRIVDEEQHRQPDIPSPPSTSSQGQTTTNIGSPTTSTATATTASERSTMQSMAQLDHDNDDDSDELDRTGLDIFAEYSPPAKRLFYRILDPDPANRSTVDEITETDWFKQITCCH